jgi:hypothetical protein
MYKGVRVEKVFKGGEEDECEKHHLTLTKRSSSIIPLVTRFLSENAQLNDPS